MKPIKKNLSELIILKFSWCQ